MAQLARPLNQQRAPFYLGRRRPDHLLHRTGRRIILLTVFAKTRPRERHEIDRAWKAMQRCITEGHVTEEDE